MPLPYRRADCGGPGWGRRRRGRGFEYLDEHGRRIDAADALARIRALVIPPAWQDVWVCPDEKGHIQAVGTDAAGRKQYIYHRKWRERRDQEKFDRMLEFAERLPRIRNITNRHLVRPGMPRERALACAVRLLDRGFFRVGGERYADENQTFGLATMRKDHVTLVAGVIEFDFIAKSGRQRIQSVVDPRVYDAVAILKRRRNGGDELLAYKEGRRWRDVRSADINDYLREVSRGDYSAKEFRTWHGTVQCALALAVSFEAQASKTARKRAITRAIKEVAHYLGNTPAVCRKSYIDPRVLDRYEGGVTIAGVLESLGDVDALNEGSLAMVEKAVLDLIRGDLSSPLLEEVA